MEGAGIYYRDYFAERASSSAAPAFGGSASKLKSAGAADPEASAVAVAAADPHTAAPPATVQAGATEADLEAGKTSTAEAGLETGPTAQTAQVPWKKVAEEGLQLQWAFVRKVYFILALQFCLAAAIVTAACFSTPMGLFLTSNPNIAVWLFCVTPLAIGLNAIILIFINRKKRPVNLLLLVLITVCFSLSIAVICSFSTTFGRALLQSLTLTVAVFIGLIFYTLVGAICQLKCTFFPSFLVAFLIMLAVFFNNQIVFQLARIDLALFGLLFSLVFCFFAIEGTTLLIECRSYE